MKNKNILLDTNAFIYLMRNEKECSNTISLENRQINESKFYDECKNANYLFITSQTLYEIFWQSIKKTKKLINLLIIMIKLLNKEKLKTNIFVIDECIKNFESSKSQYIEIRSNYEQIILNIKRIVYVESYGHNVIIHTENGEFKSKKKLSELLNQIEYFDFIQIHKSYVVNEEFINSVSSKCVILNNLIELPLGRKYSKNVKKILLIKRRK